MDAHDRRTRALLALIMAGESAVNDLVKNFQDTPEYASRWLKARKYEHEDAIELAPFLREALANMTPPGAIREAERERRSPNRTDL